MNRVSCLCAAAMVAAGVVDFASAQEGVNLLMSVDHRGLIEIPGVLRGATLPRDDFYVLNENDGEQFIKAVGEIDAKRFFIDLTDAEPEQIHEINPFEIIKTRKSYDIN